MNPNQSDAFQAADATENPSALIARSATVDDESAADSETSAEPEATGRYPWQAVMARWLLTLNPGRTQDEYAKAVRYFFETPGAPQDLDEISPDLLLAYRGALVMRAERGFTSRSARNPASSRAERLARLWGRGNRPHDLPGEGTKDAAHASIRPNPLAPATINLRLTALRQFLTYASLRYQLANLTSDHIHLSLRRLPVERRRPYQILNEEEWPAFLDVARLPMGNAKSPEAQLAPTNEPASRVTSPWGRTRAERQRAAQEKASSSGRESHLDDERGDALVMDPPLRRARDGRTGAYTAQRDYALVALALVSGLRAIELSLLDMGDLTRERRRGQDEWWLTLPDEKTKGQRGGRTLPLAHDLIAILLDYIRSTGRSLSSPEDRATPLFLALARGSRHVEHSAESAGPSSARVRRLRPEQIRGVINRVETQWLALQSENPDSPNQEVEGRRISPHALRHSAAIALLKGNDSAGRPPASVEHVRGWLGHFDIRTTQRYLDHLSSREERRKFAITPTSFSAPSRESHGASDLAGAESERDG